MTQIKLARVQYIPSSLDPGTLYVSEEFGAALHLCACGCGRKVSTPLGPAEWTLEETHSGPSLTPSIGNWQFPCRSHYWIHFGRIIWSDEWDTEKINAGRRAEEERRKKYYADLDKDRGFVRRFFRWIKGLFVPVEE